MIRIMRDVPAIRDRLTNEKKHGFSQLQSSPRSFMRDAARERTKRRSKPKTRFTPVGRFNGDI